MKNITHKLNKKNYFILIGIFLLAIGFLLGYFFSLNRTPQSFLKQIRERSSMYKYIAPLLTSSIDQEDVGLEPIKSKIKNYISDEIDNGEASKISAYYRDMDSGEWTGVNQDELYAPASMLKVSIMVAFLRKTSQDSSFVNKQVYYKYNADEGQFYKPEPLPAGYYDRLTLLKQMIVQSDNTAMRLIQADVTSDNLKLYEELEIPDLLDEKNDFMSPRSYSRFFRILYNSTYLSRSYSEQALKLLTYTAFNNGLRQGVPENIEIAHKFGENTLTKNGVVQSRELHDCGIVYYPDNPYLICVMTQGSDFSKLEKVIAGISAVVYNYQASK